MGYNPLVNGVYLGYNPLTNLLLTSWDIQLVLPFPFWGGKVSGTKKVVILHDACITNKMPKFVIPKKNTVKDTTFN